MWTDQAVHVGLIALWIEAFAAAQGHTVGLAARMEALAEAGKMYLTGQTAERVKGYFELEDLGAFHVKGVSEPVPCFELCGVGPLRTRFDVSRTRGLSRFVGRDADMKVLESALESAKRGKGRAVGLVADPGVGKSRLCFEFAERCRAADVVVLQGSGVPHGKNIPLLPILEIFRAYFGLSERDDPRDAREKIAGRLLLIDESFRECCRWSSTSWASRTRSVRRLPWTPGAATAPGGGGTEADRARQPERLRDPDRGPPLARPGQRHVRGRVRGRDRQRPRLLLLNFRPEYRADWMNKTWYQQLPLAPLGPDAIYELLRDLLSPVEALEVPYSVVSSLELARNGLRHGRRREVGGEIDLASAPSRERAQGARAIAPPRRPPASSTRAT